MKSFVIIGLGRFGTAIASELSALGHEVLAVDVDEERVQQVADHVTHAVTGDGRNIEVLRALGVRNFDCVVVAMGSDVGNSALITLNLKELGVKEVICKAQSHVHSRVLEKIGANFIELSEDYGILELSAPQSWQGKSLRELDVRNRHHVNVIAIRKNGELNVAPSPDLPLESGDQVVALGRYEDINLLHEVK